ncbi:hypothetical protein ACHAXT_006357 [Thalassiosira profunda]
MVQVSILVRPTGGYHKPNKIDSISIDSSERLETIQEKYNSAGRGSTTRLYYRGRELPLNSSIGSHNLDDFAILECCRSPALSAALSACLKDLDKVKALPAHERTRSNLVSILQLPSSIVSDVEHEIWNASSWTDEKIKPRTINFATIKAVLQRLDRYHVHDLPQCNDCQSLFNALNAHNVWRGGGRDARNRRGFNSQDHLFKPVKNNGQPSTNWSLLEEKLAIQQSIRREFQAGYGSSGAEDWLEEFVRRDDARHGGSRGRNNSRRAAVDDADPWLTHLPPNTPPVPRQNGRSATPPSRSLTSSARASGGRLYTPQYASGPFSVLATLHLAMHARHPRSNGRRYLTLTEEQLKRMAQPMCRSNLFDKGRLRGRNAFACMDGLVEKQLARKEIVRGNSGVDIEKWGLLRGGEVLGQGCAEFDRAVNQVIPVRQLSDESGKPHANLTLCLDAREDDLLLKRIKWSCGDESVPFVEKELPAGDYLFLERRNGDDHVLPLVIERKSWSDLADSCLGRGKARHRLDCVKIGGDGSACSGCQLCKMKRCGCKQIMFLIEGERCLGSDSAHRSAKKCTEDNCCSACKLLKERHGVTQDALEGVLTKLQMEHGCFIHYTNSYNETIESLFDMRQILQMDRALVRDSLPFDAYATQARRGSDAMERSHPSPTAVQELNIETMLPAAVSRTWNAQLIGSLLGVSSCRGLPQQRQQSATSGRRGTSALQNRGAIDLNDSDDDAICIDLSESQDYCRPKKRKKNDDTICLDSDSENDGARTIRGGGGYSDSSDDEIEVCSQDVWKTVPSTAAGASSIGKGSVGKGSSSSSDTSGDELFNLSRFDQSRKKRFLESPAKRDGSDSDDSDSVLLGLSARKGKAKVARKKSPAKPRAKSSAPPVRKSPSQKTQDSKSEGDDDDLCEVLEVPSQLPPLSRKRKTGATSSRATGRMPNLDESLLVVHGWGDYDKSFHKQVDGVWKEVYSNNPIDIYAMALDRLGELTRGAASPLLRRRTLMRLTLWAQLVLGLKVRVVTRMQFADELKRSIGQGRGSEALPAMSSRPPDRMPQRAALLSTPLPTNPPPRASVNRSQPLGRKTSSKEEEARLARLRKFDNAGGQSHAAAPAPSHPGKSGEWDCPRCTFKNSLDNTQCSACGVGESPYLSGQRLPQQAPARRVDSDWSCSKCTLVNDGSANNCSACDEPKPFTAAMPRHSRLPDNFDMDAVDFPNSSSADRYSKPPTKRTARCGACGQEGHNRASATAQNCLAYNDPKEVERRKKQRQKRAEIIAAEEEDMEAIEKEREQSERMQAELKRQIEALQRNNEKAEGRRKEELKRKQQKVKRLQKQQNKSA